MINSLKFLLGLGSVPSNIGWTAADSRQTNSPIIILDIGCRWGFAERFLDHKYQRLMKIFGFDPDADECARLQAAYGHLPKGFINCIPLALAEKSGKRNLFVTKEPACSSLQPPIKHLSDEYPALKCTELDRVVSVTVENLGDWASKNGLRSLDYIKIDTQGSELEILRGAGDYLLTTRCLDIEVEFNPIYEGQSLFWETDSYLRSKGFVIWRLSNLVHYSRSGELLELNDTNTVCFDENVRQEAKAFGGQLFWADARYVNSSIFSGNPVPKNAEFDRDLVLFEALGMHDVERHIQEIRARV